MCAISRTDAKRRLSPPKLQNFEFTDRCAIILSSLLLHIHFTKMLHTGTFFLTTFPIR